MKLKIVLIVGLLGLFQKSWGQDPIFTQFFNTPELYNPAFTGVNSNTKFSVAHRTQWAGLEYSLSTQFAQFSTYVDNIQSSFGVHIINNLETTTRYRFSQVNLNYAYRVELNKDWLFIPSISFGFGNKDFAFDNLTLEDQINIQQRTISLNSIDPALLNSSLNFMDISVGGLVRNDKFWIGLGLRHLNRPNISFLHEGIQNLDIFLSAQTGYKVDLYNWFYKLDDAYLYVMANYMNQGPFNRLDLGAELELNGFTFGIQMATNPSPEPEKGSLINSLALVTGFVWDHVKFGYSYDFNINNINGTNGIHEITISYSFNSIFNGDFGCWRCEH